jgi:dynein heavy chain
MVAAVPYKHLRYLTGECNYGGRVTDGSDRITLMSLLGMVYCPELFDLAHPLSPSKEWAMPGADVKEYKHYMDYIDNSLPAIAAPECFGLHDNANISKDINEANKLFESILLTQSSGGGGGAKKGAKVKSKDESIMDIATDILARLRADFDLEAVGAKYPNDPKESMNTVLIQELARYNRLLAIVRSTMQNVQKAMKGLVVLSATLEGAANDLFLGRVPEVWKSRSFSSRKPLASYFNEFLERIKMLDDWIEHGAPPIFWISGFFFTQSFLTGVSQNFARKYTIPIDDVVFDPEMCGEHLTKDSVKKPPADGAYVYGMFLEGCRWNFNKSVLDESEPKQLFSAAPTMLFKPVRSADVRKFNSYQW